jgi:hypothetical protein
MHNFLHLKLVIFQNNTIKDIIAKSYSISTASLGTNFNTSDKVAATAKPTVIKTIGLFPT